MESYAILKHIHTLLVTLFTISVIVKTILLIADKQVALVNYRSKTLLAEILISALFVILGVTMAIMANLHLTFSWPWVKLILVLILIPMGIVAFKKQNKALAVVTSLLLVLMILNSFGNYVF